MKTILMDKKIFLLILIGGASLALLYFLIIRPQQVELRKIKLELEKKEALYREYSTLSQLIDQLQEEKAALSRTINRFLETKEEEISLVIPASLMDIFKKSKVEVTSITPVPPITKENLLVSSWKISVVAGYHELSQFISTIERSMDFNRVDSLTISSGESSAKHKAQLTVSRISLKQKQ